ncbi:MAG: flippase-like domain-containing protein [Deltaproteobacteria bacterium]|nr:flippase-like domain-containing protein [Deltaproteobacteria bacterium]
MKRSTSRKLIGVAVGALFLALTAWSVEWERVAGSLAAARFEFLAPIAFLLTAHYFFKALRWRVLLSGTATVPRMFALRLTMVGFLMNNILPARIGEVGRPYLLSANRPEVPFSFALATVVGDKLFDLLIIVLMLLGLSFVLPLPPFARAGILVLVVVSLGVIGASLTAAAWERRERETGGSRIMNRLLCLFGHRRDKVRGALLGFARGLATISSTRRAFLAMLYSALAFACLGAVIHFTLLMVNLEPSVLTALSVIGLTGIGFMLPAPPTNAGNFHFFASAALMFSMEVGAEEAFSFALVSHVTQVILVTVLGAASLVGLDWRRLSHVDAASARSEELAPR